MDTASDISSCSQEAAAKVAGDASPVEKLALATSEHVDDVPELSQLASVHIDNCAEDEITHDGRCLGDIEPEDSSSHNLLDNQDSSDQNGKIPNRDSGIDSPSCTAEGEVFPNEDAIDEEDHYDSVTETESVSCCVTLGHKRDSTQDEDSDLDEGSSGEIHSLTDAQTGYLTDTHSEAHKVSTVTHTQPYLCYLCEDPRSPDTRSPRPCPITITSTECFKFSLTKPVKGES